MSSGKLCMKSLEGIIYISKIVKIDHMLYIQIQKFWENAFGPAGEYNNLTFGGKGLTFYLYTV